MLQRQVPVVYVKVTPDGQVQTIESAANPTSSTESVITTTPAMSTTPQVTTTPGNSTLSTRASSSGGFPPTPAMEYYPTIRGVNAYMKTLTNRVVELEQLPASLLTLQQSMTQQQNSLTTGLNKLTSLIDDAEKGFIPRLKNVETRMEKVERNLIEVTVGAQNLSGDALRFKSELSKTQAAVTLIEEQVVPQITRLGKAITDGDGVLEARMDSIEEKLDDEQEGVIPRWKTMEANFKLVMQEGATPPPQHKYRCTN